MCSQYVNVPLFPLLSLVFVMCSQCVPNVFLMCQRPSLSSPLSPLCVNISWVICSTNVMQLWNHAEDIHFFSKKTHFFSPPCCHTTNVMQSWNHMQLWNHAETRFFPPVVTLQKLSNHEMMSKSGCSFALSIINSKKKNSPVVTLQMLSNHDMMSNSDCSFAVSIETEGTCASTWLNPKPFSHTHQHAGGKRIMCDDREKKCYVLTTGAKKVFRVTTEENKKTSVIRDNTSFLLLRWPTYQGASLNPRP